MPTKPVTYFTENQQTLELCREFGNFLQGLTNREKKALRTVISLWAVFVDYEPRTTLLGTWTHAENAWYSSCIDENYGMCSEDVIKAIRILEEISPDSATKLIEAICDSME